MAQKINTLDDILTQIENLRDTLKFSDEIFPLVKDLFLFLKDMIPLLVEAKVSIRESTNHLPSATDNIENISKMTENSTNQVLDSIDSISSKLDDLSTLVKDDKENEKKIELIDYISEKVNEMIFSFQFQDITAQKLEHTSRILDTVQTKFTQLFENFEAMSKNSEFGGDVARALETEFKRGEVIEEKAEEDFKKETEDIMHLDSEISQDDIDRFFK